MRPTRNALLMDIASMVATRGTCDRKQVGAVIAREGRIISVGFNGAPPGLPHCDENHHGWDDKLIKTIDCQCGKVHLVDEPRERGCINATHAEANALAFAAKYGVSTDRAELFVTVSPCDTCARLLIAAGIVNVTCLEKYRDESGIELLSDAGITVSWNEG